MEFAIDSKKVKQTYFSLTFLVKVWMFEMYFVILQQFLILFICAEVLFYYNLGHGVLFRMRV